MRKDSSWPEAIADFTKNVFTPYRIYKTYGVFENKVWGGALLPGTQWSDTYSYLHSLPPGEFKKVIQSEIMDKLAKDNPALAEEFLHGLISWTNTDMHTENTFAALDAVGGAFTAYKFGAKGVSAALKLGELIQM